MSNNGEVAAEDLQPVSPANTGKIELRPVIFPGLFQFLMDGYLNRIVGLFVANSIFFLCT
jgi:hypothetical protein